MAKLFNRVKFNISGTPGTGTITVGTRYDNSMFLPAEAGAVDGDVVTYVIQKSNKDIEVGRGTVSTGQTEITRDTVLCSIIAGTAGTSKINLDSTAFMALTDAAEDINGLAMARTVTGASETISNKDSGCFITYDRATAIAVTLPQAGASSQFLDGWYSFHRNANTGTATIMPTTSTINGASSLALANGDAAMIVADGSDYVAIVWGAPVDRSVFGLDASVSGNALTIALKNASGNDPSSGAPVSLSFRSATLNNGTSHDVSIQSATSLVVSSGSSLGASNATPFRLWIVAFDDGGTVRIGVTNCSAAGAIFGLPEYGLRSSSAEGGGGGADSAGVIYTGTAVSSKPFRILGYLEWASGLTTAGTWDTAPTTIHIFGPGVPLPGAVIQSVQATTSNGSTTSTTSATYQDTPLAASITPTSPANLVAYSWDTPFQVSHTGSYAYLALRRGGSVVGAEVPLFSPYPSALVVPAHRSGTDAPGTTSPVTYTLAVKSDGSNVAIVGGLSSVGSGILSLAEIMV